MVNPKPRIGRRPVQLNRLHNYPDDKRLTREQAADIIGCSKATLANYNYAGLLPYVPSRPITVMAGDLKVCAKMLLNGVAKSLHRGLRIQAEDCPTYSRLDGVQSLTNQPSDLVIGRVVRATNALWVKYQGTKPTKGR